MQLLGWETPAMLARYDIVATSDLEEGVGRLGAYLERNPAGEVGQNSDNRVPDGNRPAMPSGRKRRRGAEMKMVRPPRIELGTP